MTFTYVRKYSVCFKSADGRKISIPRNQYYHPADL